VKTTPTSKAINNRQHSGKRKFRLTALGANLDFLKEIINGNPPLQNSYRLKPQTKICLLRNFKPLPPKVPEQANNDRGN
jgi:hypothetical protein